MKGKKYEVIIKIFIYPTYKSKYYTRDNRRLRAASLQQHIFLPHFDLIMESQNVSVASTCSPSSSHEIQRLSVGKETLESNHGHCALCAAPDWSEGKLHPCKCPIINDTINKTRLSVKENISTFFNLLLFCKKEASPQTISRSVYILRTLT